MKKNLKFITYIGILVITIAILVGATFSWLTLNNPLTTEDLGITSGSKQTSLKIEISYNQADFQEVVTRSDFEALFNLSKPSDTYDFRITITNEGNLESSNSVSFVGVRDVYADRYYSTDEDGNVTLNEDAPNVLEGYYIVSNTIRVNNTNLSNGNIYLSDLDVNDNLLILANQTLQPSQSFVLEFRIVYNEESTIQDVNININSIYVSVE